MSKDTLTMSSQGGVDSLSHVFLDLKSRSKDTRQRASYELLNIVNNAHRGTGNVHSYILD